VARMEFNRKTRRAILERAAGKCESCRANLKPGEGDFDHILPAELGGKADAINCQLLCRACHKSKTGHDVTRIRKGDRQRDKATGAIRPKGRIPSPPKAERTGKAPVPRQGGIRFWASGGHSESGN
jgi:5-methylcytosine-specific restriction protein A